MVVEEFGEFVFEFGKVLLKTELSKRGSAKLIRSLGGDETEQIILQKIGKYWNQQNRLDRPDGLVIVTNFRLVFLAKVKTITTKTDSLSFPLEFIENLEITKMMFMSPAIRFHVEGKTYIFTFFSNAGEVFEVIENAKRVLP